MKKGAATASAVALGTAATAGTATAQETVAALVFSYDYFPGSDFTVVSPLQQSTTVDVLQVDGETVDEITQPDEYDGHVIRYDDGGENAGVTTFLFTQDGLSSGDSGTMGQDAQMFSSDLNLLETSINGGNGGDGGDGGDGGGDTAGNETGGGGGGN
ncbi:calcium-binding protein [Natrinema halophilum]|uniref:Calcium-binding protein n=1 Tax=Natrinema halophilum TaxID=1699371 RepID=A0A7D5L356_9EURY|nr:calcium-binding protein [Natrinema halophilum]QLG47565.1 calcium-binding protein [Natrinema halophilum]